MPKILLIEDMPSVRSAISAVLTKAGYDIVLAENGQIGLERAEAEKFDLVITDIVMPTADGAEVIAALKSKPKAPPVIAMSGGGAGIPAEAALTLARQTADISLTKPFENQVLLDAVGSLT